MKKRLNWSLPILYAVYIIIVIAEIAFVNSGISNGLIESTGAWGYFVTCILSFLMICGCFLVATVLQIVFYRKNFMFPLFILELVKIAGTLLYFLYIDCANINSGGAVTAFIIIRTAVFAIIICVEVVCIIIRKLSFHR